MKRPALTICALLALTTNAFAATTINFDDLPNETRVTTDYRRFGVEFDNGLVSTSPAPSSGTQVLHKYQPEFSAMPITITFLSGQSSVSLMAGSEHANASATLKAFDANGALIATDGPRAVVQNACSTRMSVSATGPAIRRVELSIATSDGNLVDIGLDDLTFEGPAPPPITSSAPIVEITSVHEGDLVDTSNLKITAIITGTRLPANGSISIVTADLVEPSQHLPTGATVPIQRQTVGTTHIRLDVISTEIAILPGPQTLTVSVQNLDGLRGSATVHYVNLPAAITSRFTADGGATTYGSLRWAVGGWCTIAVYEKGAIAEYARIARPITGGIFSEWSKWAKAQYLKLVWPRNVGALCPEDVAVPTIGDAISQLFRGGRIYDSATAGAHYVPRVFVEAINAAGGDASIGVPSSEPQYSWTAKVWLYQQFKRIDHPGARLASVLEIKGSTPKLWIERQGGSLTELSGIGGKEINAQTATLFEEYPCDGRLGPCHVLSYGTRVNNSKLEPTDFCPALGNSPNWVAANGDHYAIVPVMGFADETHASNQDDASTHSCNYSRYPDGSWDYEGPWSDWVAHIDPLPEYSSVGSGNYNGRVEAEMEYCQMAHFLSLAYGDSTDHVLPNKPAEGDLIFVAGRWVFDCNHYPFGREIHPPFVWSHSRSAGSTTVANLWVNGWYTGAPVDVDLYPTPRPGPTHFLQIQKPYDSDAAMDVSVSYTTDETASSRVRIHFSSSTIRHTDVLSNYGQMKPPAAGRGYEGRWTLSWWKDDSFSIGTVGETWWP